MINLGPHSPMTYGEFERMLTTFGFTRTELPQEGMLIFRQGPTQSALIVPLGEPDDDVYPWHLLTARATILQKGIPPNLEEYSAAVQRAIRGNRMAIARKSGGKSSASKKGIAKAVAHDPVGAGG